MRKDPPVTSSRSKQMASIHSKDTKPELLVRSALHRQGFRFLLHDKRLPGKPDMVFPKYRAVIQVNGCFWHGHSCHIFKWPSTRKDFWREKIQKNRTRDKSNIAALQELGWRTLVVWECALSGKEKLPLEELILTVANWLKGTDVSLEIRGVKA